MKQWILYMYIGYSFAKINLCLDILSLRDDGYHNIFSVFVPIDWADKIIIAEDNNKVPNNNISFYSTDNRLNDLNIKDLSLVKAAQYLLPYTNNTKNIHIFLDKKVPYQAGLGIASSNAVTVLKLLNQFWECGLCDSELKNISLNIGSDCAFFWENQVSVVSCKGNSVAPMGYKPFLYPLWVLKPKHIDSSTILGYKHIKDQAYYYSFPWIQNIKYDSLFNYNTLKKISYNSFLDIEKKYNPAIKEVEDFLKQSEGIVNMSGSGSSFYIIFENRLIEEDFWKRHYKKIQKNFDFFTTIL